MASQSHLSFAQRAEKHPHPLATRLFEIAERKKSNLVLSADLTTTKALLDIADKLGPHLVVLKTHIDILSDFGNETIEGLTKLSEKHDFLIFEDRKFIDIGSTVQKQYRNGVLHIHDWAHIVNASILAGPGIIQALEESIVDGGITDRAVLILAQMTSKGSLATGNYTSASVDIARQYPKTVLGWVANTELSSSTTQAVSEEDFLVFTTGVNLSSKGDALGQQYQTPTTAMAGGSDFLIAGRGIYAASDPVAVVQEYQKAGWDAYLARIGQQPR